MEGSGCGSRSNRAARANASRGCGRRRTGLFAPAVVICCPTRTAAAPEASPSPEASEDDDGEPIRADRVAHPPEIETYVVPEYPKRARAQRIEGRVLLMVIVDESGKVEDDVKVEDSIPMLDAAAIDAVHRWSFTPARDSTGAPVRVQLEVPVRFTLR